MAELDDDVEGADFEAIFGRIAKTTGKTYANREDRNKRLRSERRAGLSANQRERLTVPKKLVNFRASEETRALLKKLAQHFGEDQTAVILRSIDQLAASVPGLQERKQWPER
jgi:hypothetical protein